MTFVLYATVFQRIAGIMSVIYGIVGLKVEFIFDLVSV